MAIFKPFRGYRPPKEIVKGLASRPYDVLNSEEARAEAGNNPYSFLRVVKPEIELPEDIDLHSQQVYDKALENFRKFIEKGYLKQDVSRNFYVYAQTWGEKVQYGIVGCAGVEDYLNGNIKKHELTRPDKEEDRMKHVRVVNANAEPVFFTYPAVQQIDAIVAEITKNAPEYDFVADDGFGHKFWVIDDQETVQTLSELFSEVPAFYVADGHHRTAAAALVGAEHKKNNANHTGQEEYNFFMAVVFPDNQLTIIDYNRVVKDLNGQTKEEFLAKLEKYFVIANKGASEYKPEKLHEFSMYLDGDWYALEAKPGTFNDNDPIGVLDVTILSNLVLDEILGIKNLRTDKRIDFVGGIRGLGELKRRVDSGEMAVAFALYPVSMKQLLDIADTGNIMPPKTTWFEPKLRSGLVVHTLD
ncbi:MAG: DUF1015 family protein [Bacteroides sp.]|jgi:uncharacterized protein (DUF1015 family)|nr:DUF1015 family protein [Bacteroides sp.]